MKKHEVFETDFAVHKDRVADIEQQGDALVKQVCSVVFFSSSRFTF